MKFSESLSIRGQLLWLLVVPMAVVILVQSVLAYWIGSAYANHAYDNTMVDSVQSLVGQLRWKDSQHAYLDLPEAAKDILEYDSKDKIFYQVVDTHQHVLYGDKNFPKPAFTQAAQDASDPDSLPYSFENGNLYGHPVRLLTRYISAPHADKTHPQLAIQLAETFNGREALADKILLAIVLFQLSLAFFSLLVMWFAVSYGLAPLDHIVRVLNQRSPSDLSPITIQRVPKEIQPLIQAMDDLLGRLANELEVQRRFVANAAHQLRTPLAGLQSQAQLALRQSNPDEIHHALMQIQKSAHRTGGLVNKLLTLAKTDPLLTEQSAWQTIDLCALAREVTKAFILGALEKGIDLGFEAPPGPVFIQGDATQIYELASNLVDNAIRYTPRQGQVTVSVCMENNQPCLAIEDSGPGIPQADRERIFERFFRILGQDTEGTGLGLAIVKEIATNHKAHVQVKPGSRGQGSLFQVHFKVPVSQVNKQELVKTV